MRWPEQWRPNPWSSYNPCGAGKEDEMMEDIMARKNKLTRVAVGIGTAIGKADRKAHQVAKAGLVAKEELEEIAKQVEVLKRQLQKTTKRLKHALRSA
jgi:hypothetical protein